VRVALISGSAGAGTCGVSDYTNCLADALAGINIETSVIRSEHWSLHTAPHVYRMIRKLQPDIVHIQYPTAGFGWKLGPQVQALLNGCVITLHEASQAHILRKLALFPFSIRPKHVIFPSEFERDFGLRWAPWISRLSSVIPIPSNIRKALPQQSRISNEIVYFGLIMPKKGLEQVVQLGALIQEARIPLHVRVIGTIPEKHLGYSHALLANTSRLPITWDLGLTGEQVANKLASSSVAYLPYPEGASERRASLKAVLLNGVAVVTTRGPQTPVELEGLVCFSATPEHALAIARSLLENPQQRAHLTDRAIPYALRYSWREVAERHSACYQQLLGQKARPTVIAVENPGRG
jgi:glycosyltransferase involved in cell wall biosynthesis